MQYGKVGPFLSASRITGPKHNILQLELGSAAEGGPAIERLGPTDSDLLSEGAVLNAVLEGVAAANQRFARSWTISRMRYAPGDSPPEAVYAHLAYSILVTWAVGGCEAVPSAEPIVTGRSS